MAFYFDPALGTLKKPTPQKPPATGSGGGALAILALLAGAYLLTKRR